MSDKTDLLPTLFANLQTQLAASLNTARTSIDHPGSMGAVSEREWRALLEKHLPRRYAVTSGFVVDSEGGQSQQLDVIIHDRHFSLLVFPHEESQFVPAESVYAVFEAKQDLSREYIGYAAEKAASVRALHRTSAQIHYAAGKYPPKEPPPIIAGVLSTSSTWRPPLGDAFEKAIAELTRDASTRIDLGCALDGGAFTVEWAEAGPAIERSRPEDSLVFFLMKLLRALQRMGTVPAIDYDAYLNAGCGSA